MLEPAAIRTCAVLTLAAFGAGANATFAVDGRTSTSSIVVATIQPRNGAPGYSWLRIYFYPSALSADDNAAATQGRVAAIGAKWTAVLQFTLDKASTVWQVDLSLPGHTCTVAETDRDAGNALQDFQFDGKNLRLRTKGTHVCDMTSLGIPNQTFAWDVDLATSVANAR